ncbi:glycoside hydrolase family 15 protein [Clavibacter michiganensis subsp. phaseoli]|uniref:Glycoside hydrolase family 15 protein n=1 Tax=Clavibacter phaseoli TaxID=1734031 RepID=A0A8I0SBY4_9MICO|nr:glycoside hydrolase family 15 protein [Clavibacter phaseoli]MBF4630505.1 glycoside hydrolase family 15 protein [Clavibacter phaseoli]
MTTPASRPAPERTDGYVALRSYAAIGDGRTVALIAEDGDIDWLPLPNLHTAPAFAAILDAPHGGRITLRPDEDFEVTRAYVPGTNVLTTTFTTASGTVRVTDALVTGVAGRLPWSELGRRVEGLAGEVAMSWLVAPGTALGTSSPWVQSTHNGPVIRVDGVTLAVVGLDHGPAEPGTQSLSGAFTTTEGSRHVITMVGTEREPVRIPNPEIVDEGIDRTIRNWEYWSAEFRYEGEWAEAVQRSALALKLLVHAPTGSIAAAATTSLPERMDGGKNWDYRFAWVRDLAYTVNALVRFGLREETHAAVSWMLRTIRDNGPDLHVFYSLEGGVPQGSSNPEVPGWRGVGPVVDGNDAQSQLQLGVFGDLFDVVRTYVRDGNVLDADTGRLLATFADRTCDMWQKRDAGMWELEDEQHYTTSKLGCWQALDCAVELAELGQIPGVPDRWRAERDRIRTWVEEECWDEGRGAYVMHPGSQRLDASILLHAVSGFDRGERMSRTLDALRSELGRGPLLYRYSGMPEEEGTFVACAFWMAGALACVGRMDEARELMDQLVDLGNDVGLYAEMIDADDDAFLGNLPQGLSHLALVSAALTIDELSSGRKRSTRTPRAKR